MRYRLHFLPGEKLVGRSHAAGRVREIKGGDDPRGERGDKPPGGQLGKGGGDAQAPGPTGTAAEKGGEGKGGGEKGEAL